MTVKNCIDTILEVHKKSHRQLARDVGYSDTTAVSKVLSRNDGMGMSISTLIKWLDELDYQIILQATNDDADELILDGDQ